MDSEASLFKKFLPTIALVVLLGCVGLFIFIFSDADVFWPGFISMIFFYGVIFFLGTYASGLKENKTTTDIMLAGRNIPLWIAIFTMSATWVGGGYINGAA